MLNIIGGLDHYDSGDLEIDGISTKKYKSRDWDTYRNNRIGFVFQSYNLIPHQSVLSNVELALTLSGVSKAERRKRAKHVLEEVGLGDHIQKRPNQLSGGQMQRVAIARALINDPEILLADEPTGALDTNISKQIMDLLTKIAKDRLVIMVTHNNQLAEKYANRIIHLTDGKITSDSRPFDLSIEKQRTGRRSHRASMSFLTAVSLSFSNLMAKKGRTFITSLAGSIGIIGIAAIIALANGTNVYIKSVEEKALSIYPMTIQSSSLDFLNMFSNVMPELKLVETFFPKNDLASLKLHLDKNEQELEPYVNTIQYKYDITPQIYLADTSNGIDQVNPDSILGSYGVSENNNMASIMGFGGFAGTNVFQEMLEDREMFEYQYDVIVGHWPENYDELILVLQDNERISDFQLYAMGLRDRSEVGAMLMAFINRNEFDTPIAKESGLFSYDTIMSTRFKVINLADKYQYDGEYKVWVDRSGDIDYMKSLVDNGIELKIVGIVSPKLDTTVTTLALGVNYTPELIKYLMDEAKNREIVQNQIANPTINVVTGKTFTQENENSTNSGFDFSKLISIDENEIKNAFKIDSSKLNMNMSGFDMPSLDMTDMQFDIEDMINDIQAAISGQLSEVEVIDMTLIQDQINQELQTYIQRAMQAYVAQIQTQMHLQIQQSVQNTMSQMGSAFSIDQDALTKAFRINMNENEIFDLMKSVMDSEENTYKSNLTALGYADPNVPFQIDIYPISFESKQEIMNFIDRYNESMKANGESQKIVRYIDIVGAMMSSVINIVNMVSHVLIAFVAISLIVSSIMIGVITYISVLERKKEIGILRAIGASKRDIRRVFNAETLIIGFIAGTLGILVTFLVCIPANAIIYSRFNIERLAQLPVTVSGILIAISMFLAFISGLFPSSAAARKDPVEALRSE